MKDIFRGMLAACVVIVVAISFGMPINAHQDRTDACMEVVSIQGELIEAQLRMIEWLQAQLDACRAIEPPVDPPVRPPVDPPTRPPVDPPDVPSSSCEEIYNAVHRDVARDRNGVWGVVNENWNTLQVPTQASGNGWAVSYHGDPQFPAKISSQFVSVGAYRSAGLQHNNSNVTLSNFIIMPNAMEPGTVFRDGTDQYGKEKWGYRVYDDEDTLYQYGYLNGGGTTNGVSATKEHGIYCSPNGDTRFNFLFIEGWGGQGLQIASRPWDQGAHNDPWTDGDILAFTDICMHENGRNLGRASFPLTVAFNRQTDAADGWAPHTANVLIDRVHIRSTDYQGAKWAGGKLIHAKGGILIRGSSSDPENHTFGGVVVMNVLFELNNSDRALMDYRNIETLTVSLINAVDVTGNRKVELRDIGVLRWTGDANMAGLNVRYEGQTVADGAESFILVNGVRQ